MSIIYAISNQKGGCGKTSLTLNLGASLARMGYKVCLVDCDPQGNMTMALGYQQPDELPVALPHIMNEIIRNGGKLDNSELIKNREYILHAQGMDFVPSSIDLADTENVLINAISREYVLKKFINYIKGDYDYILLDTMPSLNFVTINALTAANRVLIPVQPQFFSAKGLEMLLSTIVNVQDNLNDKLTIEGALITMYDSRLNFHRQVLDIVNSAYGQYFRIFDTKIPVSVRVTETQAQNRSIFDLDPKGKIAEAYAAFTTELIAANNVSPAKELIAHA